MLMLKNNNESPGFQDVERKEGYGKKVVPAPSIYSKEAGSQGGGQSSI